MSCSRGRAVLPRMGHFQLDWRHQVSTKNGQVPQQNWDTDCTACRCLLGSISCYPGWLMTTDRKNKPCCWFHCGKREVYEHESTVLKNSCSVPVCRAHLHASTMMRKDANPEAFCIVNEDNTRWGWGFPYRHLDFHWHPWGTFLLT